MLPLICTVQLTFAFVGWIVVSNTCLFSSILTPDQLLMDPCAIFLGISRKMSTNPVLRGSHAHFKTRWKQGEIYEEDSMSHNQTVSTKQQQQQHLYIYNQVEILFTW